MGKSGPPCGQRCLLSPSSCCILTGLREGCSKTRRIQAKHRTVDFSIVSKHRGCLSHSSGHKANAYLEALSVRSWYIHPCFRLPCVRPAGTYLRKIKWETPHQFGPSSNFCLLPQSASCYFLCRVLTCVLSMPSICVQWGDRMHWS